MGSKGAVSGAGEAPGTLTHRAALVAEGQVSRPGQATCEET